MKNRIIEILGKSIDVKWAILRDEMILQQIENVVKLVIETYRKDNKVLFCGNGGSAADAQHLSTELSGKFYLDRPPLFAEALHVNSSFLTAVANDYDYEEVFARALQAVGKPGDLLLALSTSGNSKNIIRSIETAKSLNMKVVGMTGASGGAMKNACDILIAVPSDDTPRIQEAHITIGHIICELVEKGLFSVAKS